MATYTSNINLKKPAQSDKIRIADFNTNADNIDAALGAGFGVSSAPSVNAEINSLADGLAIIANGNVHAAISSGQYVYVRGHGTLSNGLYVASSNISANGTLSGSNLTADASGGLNALNANIDALNLMKTSLSNANDDLANGMYYCTSVTQNIPSGGMFGCMLNIKTGGSGARRIQLLMYTTNIWIRFGQLSNNVLSWDSWMSITATAV